MTQIVQMWDSRPISGDAGIMKGPPKCLQDLPILDGFAAFCEKKARRRRADPDRLGPRLIVAAERRDDGRQKNQRPGFSELLAWTVRIPAFQSMSLVRRRRVSPTRNPVTPKSPIIVAIVRPRKGVRPA